MAAGKDPAFPLYARDLLTDEKLRLITDEELGILVRVWSCCWLEGSVPNDPAAIALLIGRDRARVKRAWKALAKFFEAGEDGRLRSRRMERERGERDELRKTRAELGRLGGLASAAARANGQAKVEPNGQAKAQPPPKRPAQATVNPSSSASSAAAGRTLQGSAQPAAAAVAPPARREPAQPAAAAPAEGPPAARPESAPEPPAEALDPAEVDAEDALLAALDRAGYRDRWPRFKLAAHARKLRAEQRLTASEVDLAHTLAVQQSAGDAEGRTPAALLAHWVDHGLVREVIDQERVRERERTVRAKAKERDPDALYGEEPKRITPKDPEPDPRRSGGSGSVRSPAAEDTGT